MWTALIPIILQALQGAQAGSSALNSGKPNGIGGTPAPQMAPMPEGFAEQPQEMSLAQRIAQLQMRSMIGGPYG